MLRIYSRRLLPLAIGASILSFKPIRARVLNQMTINNECDAVTNLKTRISNSNIAKKLKSYRKTKDEKDSDGDYILQLRILMSEVILLRLKRQQPNISEKEAKDINKTISDTYVSILYYLKGLIYYDDKRETALNGDMNHISSLFMTLQLFISGTHHDLVRDLEVYQTVDPDALRK